LDENVQVHQRVMERHPEITKNDVINAWRNFVRKSRREDGCEEYFVAVGFDNKGRLIEMVALQAVDGSWFIYHALTPPTKATMVELGLTERKAL
jgi:hypothetical protein